MGYRTILDFLLEPEKSFYPPATTLQNCQLPEDIGSYGPIQLDTPCLSAQLGNDGINFLLLNPRDALSIIEPQCDKNCSSPVSFFFGL
jgi:hypothetical protein